MRFLVAQRMLGVAIVAALAWTASNAARAADATRAAGTPVQPRAGNIARAADTMRVDRESVADAHAKIYQQLESRTKFEFKETPLAHVVDYLKDLHGIEIQFDRRALEDVGITPDTPITKTTKDIALSSALALLLRDLDLTYMVKNGALLITTPERVDAELEVRIYNVADFPEVGQPRQPAAGQQGGAMGGMGGGGGFYSTEPATKADPKPEAKPDAQPAKQPESPAPKAAVKAAETFKPRGANALAGHADLIDVITSTICPTTWDTVGGPGSIAAFQSQGLDVLIISQTREVHEQIEALLVTLRKMRDAQQILSAEAAKAVKAK